MDEDNNQSVPRSPEVEPAEVREELNQDQVTHVGKPRESGPDDKKMSDHMGAVDGETTPVRAPMSGPDDIIEDGDSGDMDDIIDPRDEMTPG